MFTVCNKRWFRFGQLLIAMGLSVIATTGCRSFPSMTNSMCPPTTMVPQMMTGQGMNQQPYQMQQAPQGYMQPSTIPMGSELGAENCVTTARSPSDATIGLGTQDDSALQAVVNMADKLQAANEENARLRQDLSQLTEDQRRHQGITLKATQFADKLRSDNTQLKTDLTSWEQRLYQLEAMVDSRESRQDDALVDIDNQLDQLIATYGSDMAASGGVAN